ncbi:MAG: hypothetical protein SGJ09_02180 [Phycisphaerae bacterium]|nr:hypothetical protein [Phycisphaerae bacterium]
MTTIIPFPIAPEGLAIDFDGGLVYWSELNTGAIERASLGGFGADTVVLVNDLAGASPPRDLGIDFDTGTMYWTDPVHSKIRTANLSGRGIASLATASSCVGLSLRFAPPPPPCDADFDANGSVDGGDLASLLGNWGVTGLSDWDLTGNGIVDGADLASLLGFWGTCPG